MLDYARRLRLAVSDAGRRAGLKAAAGALVAVAAGFLVAALWTLLARHAGLGSLGASLAVAALFGAVAAILWMMGSKVRHPAPTTEDLKREVEARASLAAEAALDKAKAKAVEVVDHAENRAHSLLDTANHKAHELAHNAEARVLGIAGGAAETVSRRAEEGLSAVNEVVMTVRQARATPGAALLTAAVVGLALAGAIRGREAVGHDDTY